jgi:molybdate transport system substrate-binding protein
MLLLIVYTVLTVTPVQAAQTPRQLVVFAAASLTDVFRALKPTFEAANPGVSLALSFGASSTLATQLGQGAPADLFASADEKQLDSVRKAGRVEGDVVIFARNQLVLIVPKENPAKITSLADLAKPGVKLILAAKNVPIRAYTDLMLEKLLTQNGFGDAYQKALLANRISEEPTVRSIAAKVALGEADAGIVYRSDVTPELSKSVILIAIPVTANVNIQYPIAQIQGGIHPELARAFIDLLVSQEGQSVFKAWNFIPIHDLQPTPTFTPTLVATP